MIYLYSGNAGMYVGHRIEMNHILDILMNSMSGIQEPLCIIRQPVIEIVLTLCDRK